MHVFELHESDKDGWHYVTKFFREQNIFVQYRKWELSNPKVIYKMTGGGWVRM